MLARAIRHTFFRAATARALQRFASASIRPRFSSTAASKPAQRKPTANGSTSDGLRVAASEPPTSFPKQPSRKTQFAPQSDEAFMLSLIEKRRPQWSLERDFYLSEAAYRLDLRNVWNRSWLFAGFSIAIPKPGDFFVYNVGDESVIIVRGNDGKAHAYHNVCRHRGSRICLEERGRAAGGKKLVCPYHQWSYAIDDGGLISAPKMNANESFDAKDLPLHHAAVRECEGLIWIAMSGDTVPPFEEASALMAPQLKPHRFGDPSRTKVAHEVTYDISANWKLVYENNRECYHCPVGHPEYSRANYDTVFVYQKQLPEGGAGHPSATDNSSSSGDNTNKTAAQWNRVLDPNDPRRAEVESVLSECSTKWTSILGMEASSDSSFPGAGWFRASRAPMRKGWVTESIDGKPVAPLMGDFREISENNEALKGERDFGSLRIHTLPNFWIHASGDHAVATRLTPNGPKSTKAVVTWLVAADAVAGKDYSLEKMLPFWQVTSEQDWRLCEANQKGVESSRYAPGPLSEAKEAGLEKFVKWYLNKMKNTIMGKDLAAA